MLGLGAAAVIAAACSLKGIDSEYGVTPPLPVASDADIAACADLANARCAAIDRCNQGNDNQIAAVWADIATCATRLEQQCVNDLLAPGTGATPQTTEACAQELPQRDCLWVNANTQLQEPEVCEPIDGGVAVSSPCFTSAQCQSGYCVMGASATCGTCQPAPVVGSPCATQSCGYGTNLGCLSSTNQCVAYYEAGAPCNQGVGLCPSGWLCVNTPADVDAASLDGGGLCVLQPTEAGASCDRFNQIYPQCSGFYCENASGCMAATLVGTGVKCGPVDGGAPVNCAANGKCYGFSCSRPAVADGQLCNTANGPLCIPPAKCVNADGGTEGTCMLAGAVVCTQ